MKLKNVILSAAVVVAMPAMAQNPFVQTWFTSDPAPMVHNGTMYVYTGHDEDNADFFWMQEWRVYSTQDMVNWQDHGSPLALESFSWADDRAWASQTISMAPSAIFSSSGFGYMVRVYPTASIHL